MPERPEQTVFVVYRTDGWYSVDCTVCDEGTVQMDDPSVVTDFVRHHECEWLDGSDDA